MSSGSARTLERNIESAFLVASESDLTEEHRAWLAQMMTIWAAGYLELTFVRFW